MRFPAPMTGADLAERSYEPADFFAPGIVAQRAVTLLSGSPKAGKSTFVRHLVRQMLRAAGTSTGFYRCPQTNTMFRDPHGIAIMSEEAETAWLRWAHEEAHAGNGRLGDLVVWPRCSETVPSGPEEVEVWGITVAEEARRRDCKVVIVDTASRFLGIQDENSVADVRRAVMALQRIAQRGLAVVAIHHCGRSGTNPRGSSAWEAEVDIVATWRTFDEKKDEVSDWPECDPGTRRILSLQGRYDSLAPKTAFHLGRDNTFHASPAIRARASFEAEALLRELRGGWLRWEQITTLDRPAAIRAAGFLHEVNAATVADDGLTMNYQGNDQ